MNKISFTDIGLVREKNQDSIFASDKKELPLFIIADGMGGHRGGEIASRDAIENIRRVFLRNQETLINKKDIMRTIDESIQRSNAIIYKRSLESLEYSGMGTTVSLCYIYESHAYIGHVGDSRIYKITDSDIIQLTEDHSLVNELVKKGEITRDEARNHPQKNMITRAVGSSPDIEVDISKVKIKGGEKLLLCTDGLYNLIKEEEILKEMNKGYSLNDIGKKLINISKKNGGYDNISLILIEF